MPAWGEKLKYNIQKAITEVLAAPRKSVLPTFLIVRESDKTKPVSARDKEVLEIRQELDSLKRAVLTVKPQQRRPLRSRLGMSDVDILIRNGLIENKTIAQTATELSIQSGT